MKPTQTLADQRPVIPPPLPGRTVRAVFRAAARLIARNGLHQGDHCPDPFDRHLTTPHADRPLSIVAAVRCVSTGDPRLSSGLSEEAVAVLASRLRVEGEPAWNTDTFWLAVHVDCWGDVEGRTTESAVAVLEAAADAQVTAVAA